MDIPATIVFCDRPHNRRIFRALSDRHSLALPMLIVFKKEKRNETVKINITEEYCGVRHGLVELIKMPDIGRFFLAYFFFNDAVITIPFLGV